MSNPDAPEDLPPPPHVTAARWARLVTAARHFDAIANRGAGPMRKERADG